MIFLFIVCTIWATRPDSLVDFGAICLLLTYLLTYLITYLLTYSTLFCSGRRRRRFTSDIALGDGHRKRRHGNAVPLTAAAAEIPGVKSAARPGISGPEEPWPPLAEDYTSCRVVRWRRRCCLQYCTLYHCVVSFSWLTLHSKPKGTAFWPVSKAFEVCMGNMFLHRRWLEMLTLADMTIVNLITSHCLNVVKKSCSQWWDEAWKADRGCGGTVGAANPSPPTSGCEERLCIIRLVSFDIWSVTLGSLLALTCTTDANRHTRYEGDDLMNKWNERNKECSIHDKQ